MSLNIHRVRLSDVDLNIIAEALQCYIRQILEDKKEEEYDDILNRAIYLYDRFTVFRRGKPKKRKIKLKDKDRAFIEALHKAEQWGFNYNTAWHLARLMAYHQTKGEFKLSKTELEIWRKKGVLDEQGKIIIETESSPLFWIQAGLKWQNKF